MDYTYGLITLLMPVILFALAVILVLALRWFGYKERMALIAQKLPIEEKSPEEKNKLFLVIGLTITLVGIALSLGLATFGLGPWLLSGLIPFFVGLAMILASLILRPAREKERKEVEEVSLSQEERDEDWEGEEQEELPF